MIAQLGELVAQLAGAQALTDRTAEALERAWQRRDELTVDDRGALAVDVAFGQDPGQPRGARRSPSKIFEVTGPGAAGGAWGFDRFWRNARTLTLHDRLAYKVHDVGQWFLNDQWPTPSFYS